MENSKKPLRNRADRTAKQEKSSQSNATSMHPLLFQLHAFLTHHLLTEQPLTRPPKLLLALSGGLDSCVLLHLLAQAQRYLPFELHAMHVHHGLSSNADAWAGFCSQQCQSLNVPLQITHVDIDRTNQHGVEAAARQLRYQALFNYQFGDVIDDFVVTAHHQDDQAETMLLQLFRGAGVKG